MTESRTTGTTIATRAVVSDPPGQPATLTFYDDDGPLGSIVLGPAECLALASDLLLAARVRYGRPREGAPAAAQGSLVRAGARGAADRDGAIGSRLGDTRTAKWQA